MSLKTENSRRVAKSRPVCMGLYAREIDTFFKKADKSHVPFPCHELSNLSFLIFFINFTINLYLSLIS